MSLKIEDALIKAWKLTGPEFIDYARDLLGPLLVENGLLAPWGYLNLQLSFEDKTFDSKLHQLAFNIANNAQSLLAELVALGDQIDIKDQLRVLGLLSILIGSGAEIPPATTRQLAISREALDIFSLSCLHSRSHQIARLVSTAINSGEVTSRGMDSLVSYLLALESPLHHRLRVISKTSTLDITPWNEMTELIIGLRKSAELMHDRDYATAAREIGSLYQKYPNCPEVTWLASSFTFYSTVDFRWSQTLDPLAYYRSDVFCYSGFNIVEKALSQAKVISACKNIVNSFCCGLDQDLVTHASSCLINYSCAINKYSDAVDLISKNCDEIIRRSNYDPFDLALFSAQLADLDKLSLPFHSGQGSKDDLEIIFVVGLPHTCWFEVEKNLSQDSSIASVMSIPVIDHMLKRVNQITKDSSPNNLSSISIEARDELRKFYMQNLAFTHGGRTVDLIIDLIPTSFKHIGMLSLVFPESKFIALNFRVEELILSYLTTIGGFNSRHATATLGELVAYVFDYANIIVKWQSLLGDRLSFIKVPSFGSVNQTAAYSVDSIINSTKRSSLSLFTSLNREPDFNHVRQLETLISGLDEYRDDIVEINTLLFGAN